MNASPSPSLPPLRSAAFSPSRTMPGDLRSPQTPNNSGGRNPPSCIQNAMATKERKPFTYTPGGLDLSEIRSEKMARRLMINAMSPGVQPKAPVFTPPSDVPLKPAMNYYNMPVPVFPCIQIPANPKELLRRTSGPFNRSESLDRSTDLPSPNIIDKPLSGKKEFKPKSIPKAYAPVPLVVENKTALPEPYPMDPIIDAAPKPYFSDTVNRNVRNSVPKSYAPNLVISDTINTGSKPYSPELIVTDNRDTMQIPYDPDPVLKDKKDTTPPPFVPDVTTGDDADQYEEEFIEEPIEAKFEVKFLPEISITKKVEREKSKSPEPEICCVSFRLNSPKQNNNEKSESASSLKEKDDSYSENNQCDVEAEFEISVKPAQETRNRVVFTPIVTVENAEPVTEAEIESSHAAEQDFLTVQSVITIPRPDSELSSKSTDSDMTSSSSYEYINFDRPESALSSKSLDNELDVAKKTQADIKDFISTSPAISRPTSDLLLSPTNIKTNQDDSSPCNSYLVESPQTSKISDENSTGDNYGSTGLTKTVDEDSTSASDNAFSSPVTIKTCESESRPASENVLASPITTIKETDEESRPASERTFLSPETTRVDEEDDSPLSERESSSPIDDRLSEEEPKSSSESVLPKECNVDNDDEKSDDENICASPILADITEIDFDLSNENLFIMPVTNRLSVLYSRLAEEMKDELEDDLQPGEAFTLPSDPIKAASPVVNNFTNDSIKLNDTEQENINSTTETIDSQENYDTKKVASSLEIDTKQFESALLDFSNVIRREKAVREKSNEKSNSPFYPNSNLTAYDDRVESPSRRSSEAIKTLNDDLDNLPSLDICSKRFSFLMDGPLSEDDPYNIPTGPPPKINLIGDLRSKPNYSPVTDIVPPWKQTQKENPNIMNTFKKKDDPPVIEPPWKISYTPELEKHVDSAVQLCQELKKSEDFWKCDVWSKQEYIEPEDLDIAREDKEPTWKKELREIANQKRQSAMDDDDYKTETEPPWRRELRELSQNKEQKVHVPQKMQTVDEAKEPVAPPWKVLSPVSFNAPNVEIRSVESPLNWSQTLKPKTWRERNADLARDKESEVPDWKRVGHMRRAIINSFIKSSPDSSTYSSPSRDTGKTPEITVEIAGQPTSVMAPPQTNGYTYPWESSPESSVAFSPEPMYDRTPTPQSRNSPYRQNTQYPSYGVHSPVIAREYGTLSFQPNKRHLIRSCPIQSRSFKYLQLLTGTDDTYEDDEPFVPQPAHHALPRPDNF